MTSSPKATWSISAAIADAWELTKRHKQLWLLGLAMVVLTAGGGGGGNSGTRTPVDEQTPEHIDEVSVFASSILEQVGIAPGDLYAFEIRFSEYVLPGVVDVSPGAYISVFVSGILLLLFGIGLAIAGTQWARASIHIGIRTVAETGKMSLEDVSTKAMARIWDYFLLGLLPFVKLFVIFFGGIIGISILVAITSLEWLSVLILPLIVYFILMLVRYAIAIIWGVWYLADTNNPGHTSAFLDGMELAKGRFWKMLVHGLCVGFIQLIVMFILVSPIIGIVGYALFQGVVGSDMFVVFEYAWPLLIVALITGQIAMAANAILQVFTTGTWYFAYGAITKGAKHAK